MAKVKQSDKLRVSAFRIIWIFAVLFIVMTAIFYISFQHDNFWPLEISFFIYAPILLVMSIFFSILTIKATYYQVDKHRLIHSKMGQVKEYQWKDILYINEEWSRKHKMLLFYMADGKDRYLAFDKEGIIFEYALTYSRLLSEEEFIARFPNAKL